VNALLQRRIAERPGGRLPERAALAKLSL